MKEKYSYVDMFWANKANSPAAELIMFYGDYKRHWIWLMPFSIIFTLFEFVVVYPIIKLEKFIRKLK